MMKKLIAVVAVLSGYILFEVLQYIVGHLSALPIPSAYFLWFGKQHTVLALAIEEAFIIALPMLILSTVWSISTNLMLGKNHLLISTACLIGYFFNWALTIINTDINFFLVLSTMFQPLYLLTTVAAPIGILFPGFALKKLNRINHHQPLVH